jgi:hypothetical protein
MLRKWGILFIFLVMGIITSAQVSLKGKVLSADTRQPVVAANVYLSSTSVGTITDAKGEFLIPRFPAGRFDLVVSFIGYETYKLELRSDQLPGQLEIVLQPKTNELKEVIVESYDKDGWEKYGKIFTDNFIGTASFSQDCKLINADAVHFKFEKKRNIIKATADEQLIIENHALGYILKYNLTLFEFNPDTKEFFFQGFPFFEEMQTDRRGLSKRWIENRQAAYYGSITHFMRSLYRNKLGEQEFEIKKIVSVSADEHKRVEALYRNLPKEIRTRQKTLITGTGKELTIKDSAGSIPEDSLAYYESVAKQPDKSMVLISTLLNADSIAYGIDSFTVGLLFDARVQVAYKPQRHPIEYQRYFPKNVFSAPINSVIYLMHGKPVIVLANGSYFDGSELMIQGYWAWWEKMCTKLPFEYWPSPKK